MESALHGRVLRRLELVSLSLGRVRCQSDCLIRSASVTTCPDTAALGGHGELPVRATDRAATPGHGDSESLPPGLRGRHESEQAITCTHSRAAAPAARPPSPAVANRQRPLSALPGTKSECHRPGPAGGPAPAPWLAAASLSLRDSLADRDHCLGSDGGDPPGVLQVVGPGRPPGPDHGTAMIMSHQPRTRDDPVARCTLAP